MLGILVSQNISLSPRDTNEYLVNMARHPHSFYDISYNEGTPIGLSGVVDTYLYMHHGKLLKLFRRRTSMLQPHHNYKIYVSFKYDSQGQVIELTQLSTHYNKKLRKWHAQYRGKQIISYSDYKGNMWKREWGVPFVFRDLNKVPQNYIKMARQDLTKSIGMERWKIE